MSSDFSPALHPRTGQPKWVGTKVAPTTKDDEQATPEQVRERRFVEPLRLSDAQRAKVLGLLEKRGIGDAESRDLFVSAMEYDLAGCADLEETPPDEPAAENWSPTTKPADGALTELGAAAEALAHRLAALDQAARKQLVQRLADADPFKRGYGEPYLAELHAELARLGTCASPPEQAVKRPQRTIPAPTDGVRRFVQRAAEAFRDCFEQEPTAKRGAPFPAALKAVVSVSGIRVPVDTVTIHAILGQDGQTGA